MNILYLKIKELADKKGVSLAQIERDLNFSNGIISSWKNGRASQDKLAAIADYFGVSTDYLLGRTPTPEFTAKDERDIQKIVGDLIDGLSNENSLACLRNGGEEIDEDDAELIKAALEKVARRSKILAKEKFTPDKYK